jgi:hypothetical protein
MSFVKLQITARRLKVMKGGEKVFALLSLVAGKNS